MSAETLETLASKQTDGSFGSLLASQPAELKSFIRKVERTTYKSNSAITAVEFNEVCNNNNNNNKRQKGKKGKMAAISYV